MPVWQAFYEKHRNEGVEVLSVAMDVQSSEKARPYVEKAGAAFTTVVDQGNHLGQLYGFKAVPNGFLIDERGVVQYKKLGGFDIRRQETAGVLARWVDGSDAGEAQEAAAPGDEHAQANAHFRRGLELYQQGKTEDALAEWRKGMALEPDNWIIRKQVWAVEHPERFYDGDVDYAWQKERVSRGE